MKSLFVLTLVSLSLCDMDLEKYKKIAYQVIKLRTTWKAKEVPTDIEGLLGHLKVSKNSSKKNKFRTNVNELTEFYDLREAFPNYDYSRN